MVLRVCGEIVGEVIGVVVIMWVKMFLVEVLSDVIDIVGIGGDNLGSYNIFICMVFVVVGCGVNVVKYGN